MPGWASWSRRPGRGIHPRGCDKWPETNGVCRIRMGDFHADDSGDHGRIAANNGRRRGEYRWWLHRVVRVDDPCGHIGACRDAPPDLVGSSARNGQHHRRHRVAGRFAGRDRCPGGSRTSGPRCGFWRASLAAHGCRCHRVGMARPVGDADTNGEPNAFADSDRDPDAIGHANHSANAYAPACPASRRPRTARTTGGAGRGHQPAGRRLGLQRW